MAQISKPHSNAGEEANRDYNAMFIDILIVATVAAVALLLFSRSLRRSTLWRAMATPLASIIGSGFLVLGPILDFAYGAYAILVMFFLCVASLGFGSAIRFNLAHISDGAGNHDGLIAKAEDIASCALALAYVVSVSYYLNLFGAFSVSLTTTNDPIDAKLVSTAVFLVIMVVGWTRGFRSLERLEYITVSIKLAIIAGLLVGLAGYFYGQAARAELIVNTPELSGWAAVTLAFGLIITVQGFETSRYLVDEYDPKTCIRSMFRAQLLASLIYLTYAALLSFVFAKGELETSETAIVGMMKIVAPVLPAMLVAAALAAQFSAAVADTSGSGGLVHELTRGRINARSCYVALAAIGIVFTWTTDIFELINYASRAFAVYYAIQSAIAALTAWKAQSMVRCVLYTFYALLGVLIVITGAAVEHHS